MRWWNCSTLISTWWTISSSSTLPSPTKKANQIFLKSVRYVSVVDSAIRAVCGSLVFPSKKIITCTNQEIGSPNKTWPHAVPILLSTRWLYYHPSRAGSSQALPGSTRSEFPHYKPLLSIRPVTPLCNMALPSSVRELPRKHSHSWKPSSG